LGFWPLHLLFFVDVCFLTADLEGYLGLFSKKFEKTPEILAISQITPLWCNPTERVQLFHKSLRHVSDCAGTRHEALKGTGARIYQVTPPVDAIDIQRYLGPGSTLQQQSINICYAIDSNESISHES
jgi:hypothetical protein